MEALQKVLHSAPLASKNQAVKVSFVYCCSRPLACQLAYAMQGAVFTAARPAYAGTEGCYRLLVFFIIFFLLNE